MAADAPKHVEAHGRAPPCEGAGANSATARSPKGKRRLAKKIFALKAFVEKQKKRVNN
jgi:hypothetical protein